MLILKMHRDKKWLMKDNLYFSLNECTLFSEQSAFLLTEIHVSY